MTPELLEWTLVTLPILGEMLQIVLKFAVPGKNLCLLLTCPYHVHWPLSYSVAVVDILRATVWILFPKRMIRSTSVTQCDLTTRGLFYRLNQVSHTGKRGSLMWKLLLKDECSSEKGRGGPVMTRERLAWPHAPAGQHQVLLENAISQQRQGETLFYTVLRVH